MYYLLNVIFLSLKLPVTLPEPFTITGQNLWTPEIAPWIFVIGRVYALLWVHLNWKESGFHNDEFFMSMETDLNDEIQSTISVRNKSGHSYSIPIWLPDENRM